MIDNREQNHRSTLIVVAIAIMFVLALCSGCSTTVPVTAKFPPVPERLLEKCPNLEKLKDDPQLSDLAKTINNNYTTYYTCAVKNDAWIEWYNIQKTIFEGIAK